MNWIYKINEIIFNITIIILIFVKQIKNMNSYFKSARDNIFLYLAYIAIIAFFLFISIELLRLSRPIKFIGILGIIGSIWAIFKYPDFQKYLTTKKQNK